PSPACPITLMSCSASSSETSPLRSASWSSPTRHVMVDAVTSSNPLSVGRSAQIVRQSADVASRAPWRTGEAAVREVRRDIRADRSIHPHMVVVAQNLAYAEPAVAPRPRPAAPPPPRRDVGWQLAELHERHAGELLRFCRWMLRDRDDAADALQDTWIRAMSALGEERVRVTAMRPWLYAIARNACLDRLRERKRASCHELDESALGDAPAADEVAGLRNEARAALALIGTLSERQRSALLMRELAGMSVPEIADALGLTVERAQWTIADARKAL